MDASTTRLNDDDKNQGKPGTFPPPLLLPAQNAGMTGIQLALTSAPVAAHARLLSTCPMSTGSDNRELQGARVPVLGLGTWRLAGDDCRRTVEEALSLGYRHLDTAQGYENEASVGAAIRASKVLRNELFLTTSTAETSSTRPPSASTASPGTGWAGPALEQAQMLRRDLVGHVCLC